MISKIIPIMASMALIGTASLTAYAAEPLDKDYIVSEIWEDWWFGEGDDGTVFPEASYKHHILNEWVNDNYGNDDYSWNDIGSLKYYFKDYYKELIEDWDFNDDREGNWTIETDSTTYHFNFQNGEWLMSDDNGNVIDSFMPFNTLEEDEDIHLTNEMPDENNTAHRVGEGIIIGDSAGTPASAGTSATFDVATSESIADTEEGQPASANTPNESGEIANTTETSNSSNGLLYTIGGIALAGIGFVAGMFVQKKRG